jgi:rare lipoprotein A
MGNGFLRAALALALALAAAAGCGGARLDARSQPGGEETGLAVYYADSLHGRPTASGEPYDKGALTAAHRKLTFGTKVRVTRLDDRKSVVVRINDRGPFGDSRRIIDLSRAAAERIGMTRAGVVEVRVEIVSVP